MIPARFGVLTFAATWILGVSAFCPAAGAASADAGATPKAAVVSSREEVVDESKNITGWRYVVEFAEAITLVREDISGSRVIHAKEGQVRVEFPRKTEAGKPDDSRTGLISGRAQTRVVLVHRRSAKTVRIEAEISDDDFKSSHDVYLRDVGENEIASRGLDLGDGFDSSYGDQLLSDPLRDYLWGFVRRRLETEARLRQIETLK